MASQQVSRIPAWHESYKTRQDLETLVGGRNLSQLSTFNPVYLPVRNGDLTRFEKIRTDRRRALKLLQNVLEHKDSEAEEQDETEEGEDVTTQVSAVPEGENSSSESESVTEEPPVDELEQRYRQHGWFMSSSGSSSSSSGSSSSSSNKKSSSSTNEVPPIPDVEDDDREKFANVYVYKHAILGGTEIGSFNHWRLVTKFYNKNVILEGVPHNGYIVPIYTVEADKPVGTRYTLLESSSHDGIRSLPDVTRVRTSPAKLLALAKNNPLNGYLYIPLLADCQVWVEYASAVVQEWAVE